MTAPTGRRLADRLLDEGTLVAQSFAEQDRLDPTRPTLGVLVAEAIALAERRGELRVLAARDEALSALADLVRAADELLARPVRDRGLCVDLTDSIARARRHLQPVPEEPS